MPKPHEVGFVVVCGNCGHPAIMHGKDGCIAQLDFQPNRWTFCKCRGFTVEEPCADAQPEPNNGDES